MATNNTQRRSRSKPEPEMVDDVDSVELGTEIALAGMQAMITAGMEPVEAAAKCWALPELFLTARATWIDYMESEYGADSD